MTSAKTASWADAIRAFAHPRVLTMLFLGLSAGLPILLIFSTLSAWLREAEVARSAVTFFSWAALGYSFKYLWAPLVDRLPVPGLTDRFGQRRGWLLVAQLAIACALLGMASQDPANNLTGMAIATLLLGFSSATQDIVIDAYRIEAADEELQAMMSASYIAGYRVGMLVAGAGSLFLADLLGSDRGSYNYTAWALTYAAMASCMLIGIITTLIISEPERRAGNQDKPQETVQERMRFIAVFALAIAAFAAAFFHSGDLLSSLGAGAGAFTKFLLSSGQFLISVSLAILTAMLMIKIGFAPKKLLKDSYVGPFADFFSRYGKAALMILLLIAIYRISDIVMGSIANVFYLDMGYSKTDIAEISKIYGLFASLIGGFGGGLLAMRFGVMKILWLGAFLSAVTNLLFAGLASHGEADRLLLTVVIGADNVAQGIATSAFVAYLSSLTNISFTATQFALFGSLMTLFPKVLAGYSGSMVDAVDYPAFFIGTAILGVPVLILIVLIARKQRQKKPETP